MSNKIRARAYQLRESLKYDEAGKKRYGVTIFHPYPLKNWREQVKNRPQDTFEGRIKRHALTYGAAQAKAILLHAKSLRKK